MIRFLGPASAQVTLSLLPLDIMKSSQKMGLKALSALAFGAIAVFAASNPAQAFSFKMTSGVAGPGGERDQGAFSEFYGLDGTTNIDFNDGLPADGFASYSVTGSNAGTRNDVWAPTGAQGDKNTSNYLTAFKGSDVVIDLKEDLNYFGINWGAADDGNTFSFYKGDTLIQSYDTARIIAEGGFSHNSGLHNGEGNGYVHFYSDSASELFDRIVISEANGGGFETDNHSFHVGDSRFEGFDLESQAVPEPAMMLGLLGIMGGTMARRKKAAA